MRNARRASPFVIENATAILTDRLLPDARVVLRAGRIADMGRTSKRALRDAHVIDARAVIEAWSRGK